MRIVFEEDGHRYKLNGNIADISVTELLAKHGLAPKYEFVKEDKKKESAELGKKVHKDLENILNKENYDAETEQGRHFQKWVRENLDCGVGEQMLGYEFNGWRLCGTADVMGILKDKTYIVADHKNTAQFHREYVSWQVSLLDYMARKLGKERLNGKALNWKGASKFYCFHYDPKTGDMKVYQLDKIPDSEIEELIQKEYNGEIYQRKELVVAPELQLQFKQAEQVLLKVEQDYKLAQENAQKVREELLKLFEEQHILQWKCDDMTISYVPETDTTRVDGNKLKREYPQVFANVQKLSKKKAYIRITTKESEEE